MDGKCHDLASPTHHPAAPGQVTDKMAARPIINSLGWRKLARDETPLYYTLIGHNRNHHTGVGIAGYRRGIEVIREAAALRQWNHTMLTMGNIEGPTRRSAPHNTHPKGRHTPIHILR